MSEQNQSPAYQLQLSEKQQRLEHVFSPYDSPIMDIFHSAEKGYRMRAEFRVWHDDDDLYHIMFDPRTKEKYRVDQFPPASASINRMMSMLIADIRNHPLLRKKLFQIDYLSGLSEEMVVSLLYHRQLDDEWEAAANELKQRLAPHFAKVNIIGRARKQKRVLGEDFIIESLPVLEREYKFKHIENSFTQPNAAVNCKMIEWALSVCPVSDYDLLELYCGAGNFSLPMAQRFRRVVGTEIAKPSVSAAQYNIAINNIENVDIVRLSAEEFTHALTTGHRYSRLKEIDLNEYQFSTVLVDPPRAGLDEDSLKMIQKYDEIIYISCNPETLSENLETLCQTHAITHTALFDQFPFTHHIEAGVKLSRKK